MSKNFTLFLIIWVGLSAGMLAQNKAGKNSYYLERNFFNEIFDIKPIFSKPDTISISVIGDVMMHTKQLNYDYSQFLEEIRNKLSDSDLSIANMEFALGGKPYTGYPAFSAPDGYAEYVADCGVDVFLTANNHILDKGKSGIERTIGIYRKMEDEGKIRFTGIAGSEEDDIQRYPLILAVKGIRIAFVNFTYGTNTSIASEFPKVNRMEKTDIAKAIERAKEQKADFIVALPHWGTEYKLIHSESQEKLAVWLAEQGADIIVGAHPHVVQDSTNIRTSSGKVVPVFYSIGNAISNMSAINTRLELMVKIKIAIDKYGEPEIVAPGIDFLWCTLPGMLKDNYTTISVKDFIGKRDLWKNKSDYDNMLQTYRRVKETTKIED